MKLILFLMLLFVPVVFASHGDIPYYTYDSETRPTYYYGTPSYPQPYNYPQYYSSYPSYSAGYRNGNLYEKYGYTTEYEIQGEENDGYYGYSKINDRYKTRESYERTVEYDYDNYGRYYGRYDPRYDGRTSRILSGDYYDGYHRPSLYGSGRIAIEDSYGPVYYNYRGQRYGFDAEGRRFYY